MKWSDDFEDWTTSRLRPGLVRSEDWTTSRLRPGLVRSEDWGFDVHPRNFKEADWDVLTSGEGRCLMDFYSIKMEYTYNYHQEQTYGRFGACALMFVVGPSFGVLIYLREINKLKSSFPQP